jgi:hypothetical protein
MPFTKSQLLMEAQRRGLIPKFTQDQLMAEAQRRGLFAPQPMPDDVPFGDLNEFVGQPPPQPSASIPDKLLGGAEAGLSMATGATGGTLGMVGGAAKGAYDQITKGQFGTPAAADAIEKQAMAGARAMTYEPRTSTGQEYVQNIGETLAPLQAVGPNLTGIRPTKVPEPATVGKQLSKQAVTPETQDLAVIVKGAVKKTPGGRRARKILADLAAPDPEVLASAKRLGVDDYLQPDHVATSQQFRDVAQLAKSMPGSEIRALETEGLARVAQRANNLITELGGVDDISLLADEARSRLSFVQKALDDKVTDLSGKLSAAVPENAPVRTDNILGALNARADRMGGIKFLSPAERRLHKALTPTDKYKPTYGLLDEQRKEIGAATQNKGAFKDARTGLSKHLYRALLEDQKLAADQYGAQTQFNLFRKATRLRKGVEDDMTALFGKHLDKTFVAPLTTAFKRIPKGDIDSLEKVINSIPKGMRQKVVVSGLAVALGKMGKVGEISFNEYANWYQNASRNRSSFNKLLKHMPSGAERSLRDLYNVANGIRKAQKEYKPTGRGEVTLRAGLEGADGFLKNLFANSTMVGTTAGLESMMPGAGFAYAAKEVVRKLNSTNPRESLNELLASVQFRRVINERVRTGTSSDAAVKGLARSKAFQDYVKEYGVGVGKMPELWILDAMRSEQEFE